MVKTKRSETAKHCAGDAEQRTHTPKTRKKIKKKRTEENNRNKSFTWKDSSTFLCTFRETNSKIL